MNALQHTLHTQFVNIKGAGPPTRTVFNCCASASLPPFVVGVCIRAMSRPFKSAVENSLLFSLANKAPSEGGDTARKVDGRNPPVQQELEPTPKPEPELHVDGRNPPLRS